MKKCTEGNGKMAEQVDETPEGVEYKYFKCKKCGEEIVHMKQLHDVAQVLYGKKTLKGLLTKEDATKIRSEFRKGFLLRT